MNPIIVIGSLDGGPDWSRYKRRKRRKRNRYPNQLADLAGIYAATTASQPAMQLYEYSETGFAERKARHMA